MGYHSTCYSPTHYSIQYNGYRVLQSDTFAVTSEIFYTDARCIAPSPFLRYYIASIPPAARTYQHSGRKQSVNAFSLEQYCFSPDEDANEYMTLPTWIPKKAFVADWKEIQKDPGTTRDRMVEIMCQRPSGVFRAERNITVRNKSSKSSAFV